MLSWVQENWIICLVVVLLLIALVWWLRSGKKPVGPGEAVITSETPTKKPLEPAKPDIVVAEPARFKTPEQVAVPSPLPSPTAAPQAAPAQTTPDADGSDNLQLLKGVGPKLAKLLTELGVTSFAQIAAWSDDDIAAIDSRLGTFQGRIERDNWVDQADYLVRGDKAGFEAKYGILGGEL